MSEVIKRRGKYIIHRSNLDIFSILRFLTQKRTIIVFEGDYQHITQRVRRSDQIRLSNTDRRGKAWQIITHKLRFNMSLRCRDHNVMDTDSQRPGKFRHINIVKDKQLNTPNLRVCLSPEEYDYYFERELLTDSRPYDNDLFTIDLSRCSSLVPFSYADIDHPDYSHNKLAELNLKSEEEYLCNRIRVIVRGLFYKKSRKRFLEFQEFLKTISMPEETTRKDLVDVYSYELTDTLGKSSFRRDYYTCEKDLNEARQRLSQVRRLIDQARLETRIVEYALWLHESEKQALLWRQEKIKRTVYQTRVLASGIKIRRRKYQKSFSS